jgi:hypothetical protein
MLKQQLIEAVTLFMVYNAGTTTHTEEVVTQFMVNDAETEEAVTQPVVNDAETEEAVT